MEPQFEAVEIEGDSCLGIAQFECAQLQQNHNWHYHPEFELTSIVRGEGTRFVGDSVGRFRPGDIVFVGPNTPHCWTNDDSAGPHSPQRNQFFVLQFKADCLGADFANAPDARPLKALFETAGRGMHFHSATAANVHQALIRVLNSHGLTRLSEFLHLLDIMSKAEHVELLSSDMYQSNNAEFHGGRMDKILAYVKANLDEEIKQTDVAELVAMTPQGFSRFFRATTGRTFVSFVNVMRIMRACELLVNTKSDIIDIAFECGYANLSNFNRRFAELKKTTPRQYRQQHGRLLLPE